jgi:hypothetical protein
MKCEKCSDAIPEGEEREHAGRILCEDCYMDTLSPAKSCDPWAVHSAKALSRARGGNVDLNETQKRILEILKETGGVERGSLVGRLGIKPSDLEREIAALRHAEKVRAEMRDDRKVFIVLW